MNSYLTLGYGDIALAATLLCINAGVSAVMQLGLGKRLALSAIRMVVQLTAVGLVLKALFVTSSPWLIMLVAAVMVAFAGYEAYARQDRHFGGLWSWGLGVMSMAVAALLVTVLALGTAVRPDPWYHPQYAIPLLGMVLGNTLTGVSLGLERLIAAAVGQRAAIEARLLTGATIGGALKGCVREAIRTGMIPTINAMAATGVVALPGMMTGQILAGVDPIDAVKYQLLIMFLIAGGTGLGLTMAVLGGARLLGDDRHRLRLDRLTPSREV